MTAALDHAASRLVDLQILDASEIVDGRVRLAAAASRNLALWVEREGRPAVLVKEPDPSLPAARRTVAAEGRFYAFCRKEPRAALLAPFLAAGRSHPDGEARLLVDHLEGGRPLWRLIAREGLGEEAQEIWRQLGHALAALHLVFERPGLADDPRLQPLPSGPPEPFDYALPDPRMLRVVSPANLEICRLLQADSRALESYQEARRSWRDESLIHGDVRSDNVLVLDGAEAGGPRIRLLDWEFVQIGDPAWDLADVLRDFAALWVFGMSWRPDLDVDRRLDSAATPLDALRPSLAAFWSSYLDERKLPREAARQLSLRAARASGIRLVQNAWEYSAGSQELSSRDVLLLQVAINVLHDPERALDALYGL